VAFIDRGKVKLAFDCPSDYVIRREEIIPAEERAKS
jgi:sRNA-binding carbon storage regulator CsrA